VCERVCEMVRGGGGVGHKCRFLRPLQVTTPSTTTGAVCCQPQLDQLQSCPFYLSTCTPCFCSESTFFGAYPSNHAAQTGSYAQPLLEWLDAGRVLAQSLAAEAKVTCPATAAVFACHLAPWGFQSDDQTRYMVRFSRTRCV
jgi:hypothetical protein